MAKRKAATTRLAREAAKLDPAEEKALAEEGMAADAAVWPDYFEGETLGDRLHHDFNGSPSPDGPLHGRPT